MPTPQKTREVRNGSQPESAAIQISLFDGTRNAEQGAKVLLRVRDGSQKEVLSKFISASNIRVKVPFHDNFIDNYSVIVTAEGFRDAGFYPVKVSPGVGAPIDLMLVPKGAKYRFMAWDTFATAYPRLHAFLTCDGDEAAARSHYESLAADTPAVLACLLNLAAAMDTIQLPCGTPLDYFKTIEWGSSLAQDRCFGFADAELVKQVKMATAQGMFAKEPSPAIFHPDATSSYKQKQFGEANVQLTFHENTVKTIQGSRCIRVEPDIDYYSDPGAHALLEVIPNTLSHSLTDPQVVYVLRWIAGRHAGVPEFDPSYALV